jgi:hypothetical protein
MLRIFVLLLLLANGLYFAWTQGLMRELGWGPVLPTEAHRLAQQIKPGALTILSAEEARRVEAVSVAPKAAPAECLEAGLFDDKQSAALRRTLEERWPSGSWSLQATELPARWIVYMGKFASTDAASKKKAELKTRNVAFESLRNPALEPGIGLGGHDSLDGANLALKELTLRGVRTARVVQEKPAQHGETLRLLAVDDKLRSSLEELKGELAGKPLHPCVK